MKKVLFLWVVGISLTLAACGSRVASPSTEITVNLADFQYSPNSFTVPAGQEITLNAENTGGVVHSFVIMQKGQSAGTEYNDEDRQNVYWEVEVQPGGTIETAFIAPADPGDYEVVCHIPGHLQAGMVGKLTVVADE
jgi:uncharacterized cupredoxin-like copper-binding protein